MQTPEMVVDQRSTPGVLSAKLWIRRGSGCDPHHQRGGHQLLGSLLSRGCGPYGPEELADLVEGCGAGLRSDTNEDGTLISLKCRDRDADRLLPVIGWMVSKPHLRQDQIELERELSLQALLRQGEDPFQLTHDGWRSLAYGSGPYGHDPLGIAADLETLEPDQLRALHGRLMDDGAVLALSGTAPDSVVSLINAHEAFRSSGVSKDCTDSEAVEGVAPLSGRDSSATIAMRELPTEQVVLLLGQPTIPHGHVDEPALHVLQAHLGQGMSSLLFRRLREIHGVAYDVGVHHPARAKASPFVFHASTSTDRASMTLKLLLESWEEMTSTTLTESELSLARTKVRGQLAHASQTSGQRAERQAQLRGLGLTVDHDQRCLERISALTASDIRDAAARHLRRPLLSLCGPDQALRSLRSAWEASHLASPD